MSKYDDIFDNFASSFVDDLAHYTDAARTYYEYNGTHDANDDVADYVRRPIRAVKVS